MLEVSQIISILKDASQKLPELKFAWGLLGISAVSALIIRLLGADKASFIIIALTIIGVVIVFVASIAFSRATLALIPAQMLIWSITLFFIIFLGFTVTAFAISWPCNWTRFLEISTSECDYISIQTNNNIPGIWFGEYSYSVSSGLVTIKGTTEYFKNGSYNFIGQLKYSTVEKNIPVNVLYNIDGTGEWSSDSNSLFIKLQDLKSNPLLFQYNHKSYDINRLSELTEIKFSKLERNIPKGLSEEYRIVSIKNDNMILEVDNPKGELFQISMLKKKMRFQR